MPAEATCNSPAVAPQNNSTPLRDLGARELAFRGVEAPAMFSSVGPKT